MQFYISAHNGSQPSFSHWLVVVFAVVMCRVCRIIWTWPEESTTRWWWPSWGASNRMLKCKRLLCVQHTEDHSQLFLMRSQLYTAHSKNTDEGGTKMSSTGSQWTFWEVTTLPFISTPASMRGANRWWSVTIKLGNPGEQRRETWRDPFHLLLGAHLRWD